MAKNKDAKRREKLAKKAKHKAEHDVTPYEGTTYQAESWNVYVAAVEQAVFDVIELSNHGLTNSTVKYTFEMLVRRLRKGLSPTLADDEIEIVYSAENQVEFLIRHIRGYWKVTFEKLGSKPTSDMIGILRTLLYAILAHADHTGSSRGYVEFVWEFFNETASGPADGTMSDFDDDDDDDFDEEDDGGDVMDYDESSRKKMVDAWRNAGKKKE